MRRINADGIALIKQWEGLRLETYRCSAGVLTIGYGHTSSVIPGMHITETEAERLLMRDLAIFEAEVSRAVDVEITDNQFAALVSWTYNIGVSAMRGSTLIRKLNTGDYASVPAELARWNKIKGVVSPGLSNRRAAEAGLWARGSFVSSRDIAPTTPAYNSNGVDAGKIGGVAAAVATVAPALTSLGGLHWAVGVALVAGAVALAAIWLLKKRDA
jgi:lysozyme